MESPENKQREAVSFGFSIREESRCQQKNSHPGQIVFEIGPGQSGKITRLAREQLGLKACDPSEEACYGEIEPR
jgi:hypothetical protein